MNRLEQLQHASRLRHAGKEPLTGKYWHHFKLKRKLYRTKVKIDLASELLRAGDLAAFAAKQARIKNISAEFEKGLI